MDNSDKLARAIRGLTIAIWCWIGFQALTYAYSMWNFWSVTQGTNTERVSHAYPASASASENDPDGEPEFDNDFSARPIRDKIRLATAILLVEMKEEAGVHKALVQEVLKVKPGIRLYYKVGDEYDEMSHYPGGGCGDCTLTQHSLVFMMGNPATMRFSTTFEGDRLASLGGMTIDELRRLAQESLSTAPSSKP